MTLLCQHPLLYLKQGRQTHFILWAYTENNYIKSTIILCYVRLIVSKEKDTKKKTFSCSRYIFAGLHISLIILNSHLNLFDNDLLASVLLYFKEHGMLPFTNSCMLIPMFLKSTLYFSFQGTNSHRYCCIQKPLENILKTKIYFM